MPGRVVVDLRNIYKPDQMAEAGFAYTSIGRPKTAGRQTSVTRLRRV
jgi:UDPglucose 6-dehydrogenase